MVLADIRKTYEGPLALAVDYMVFNVIREDVKVRMAAIDEDNCMGCGLCQVVCPTEAIGMEVAKPEDFVPA